jgi:hypothetical protein
MWELIKVLNAPLNYDTVILTDGFDATSIPFHLNDHLSTQTFPLIWLK